MIPRWPRPASPTADGAIIYKFGGDVNLTVEIQCGTESSGVNGAVPMTAFHCVNAIPSVIDAQARHHSRSPATLFCTSPEGVRLNGDVADKIGAV